jgi:hypothetical protein
VLEVIEHEDLSIHGAQTVQRCIELIGPLTSGGFEERRRARVHHLGRLFPGASLSSTILINAGISCDSEDPGTEGTARIEAIEVPQDLDEGVLSGVSCVFVVAKHASREAKDGWSPLSNEPVPRRLISSFCTGYPRGFFGMAFV